MSKPVPLPGAAKLAEVCEATWPPASQKALGAWTIRDGQGGGNRVSAATLEGAFSEADIDRAEAGMRGFGQAPLFMVRASRSCPGERRQVGSRRPMRTKRTMASKG